MMQCASACFVCAVILELRCKKEQTWSIGTGAAGWTRGALHLGRRARSARRAATRCTSRTVGRRSSPWSQSDVLTLVPGYVDREQQALGVDIAGRAKVLLRPAPGVRVRVHAPPLVHDTPQRAVLGPVHSHPKNRKQQPARQQRARVERRSEVDGAVARTSGEREDRHVCEMRSEMRVESVRVEARRD